VIDSVFIAGHFGGGGHHNAAGCAVDFDTKVFVND